MILYDAVWAPSPRRVRIYIAEKGIEVERVEVDLRANEQLSEPYLRINPRGAVPALKLDSGEVICESAAICRYFEALHPAPPMFGETPIDIARIEAWTRRIETDGYAAAAYVLRNTRDSFRDRGLSGKWPAIAQIPELAERGAVMWDVFVGALDAHLAGREWIAADSFSFADISALVTIDFGKAARLSMPDHAAHLAAWYARASTRPSASA